MKDEDKPTFLEVQSTDEANQVDMTTYRLERFSDTKNAWEFVKRRTKTALPLEKDDPPKPNFMETDKLGMANQVDMGIYRFETFSERRGTWMFVKRRVI